MNEIATGSAPRASAPSDTPVRMATGRKAYGGKTIYGARVGMLFLDTVFPRVPGDFGNLLTWPFPVLLKVVRGATPAKILGPDAIAMAEPFLEAAKDLVAAGADGITTSCGFLSLVQDHLAANLDVPVAASPLMQVPFVQPLLPPGKRVGVITVSTRFLGPRHLAAAGAPPDTPLVGCEDDCAFVRAFAGNTDLADMAAAEADVLAAGRKLMTRFPEIGGVVLECTNMVPFSRALSEHIGVPVWDAYSFVCWFQAGLAPRDFGHPGSATRPWRER